jgi:NDP-sugar pyrophosphorylase family protein
MANLNIIITMAGASSRFFRVGYRIPKYMVSVGARSLFGHSLSSLPLEIAERIIFIALDSHRVDYGLESFLEREIKLLVPERVKVLLKFIVGLTRGQSETALAAREFVGGDEEILIYNIDTMFRSSSLKASLLGEERKGDGIFGVFPLDYPDSGWSFARFDKEGLVTETAEKMQISSYVSTGLYHFTRAEDFFSAADCRIRQTRVDWGEFYVAPLYNDLIARGRQFRVDRADEMMPLGTPGDVERFSLAGGIISS